MSLDPFNFQLYVTNMGENFVSFSFIIDLVLSVEPVPSKNLLFYLKFEIIILLVNML